MRCPRSSLCIDGCRAVRALALVLAFGLCGCWRASTPAKARATAPGGAAVAEAKTEAASPTRRDPHLEAQVALWREWARGTAGDELKQDALKQLAWLKDPEGVKLCIQALKDPSGPIQATAAAALTEYGSPLADRAKPALFTLLETGGLSKPHAAWALVELRESSAFERALEAYRVSHLSVVQKLNGTIAFDPNKMAGVASLDQLAQLADDANDAVRQLVAVVLSRRAEPRFADVLIKLSQDPVFAVAQQAAPGLARLGDERSRDFLLKALAAADKEGRQRLLQSLRDASGTAGLVMALGSVSSDRTLAWYQTQYIFDLIEGNSDRGELGLNDPSGGDALAAFIDTNPHIHWQTRAALALAKIGDLRAVPTLARRLRMNPLELYSDDYDFEMLQKRDDNERVAAARMIADLGQLHPKEAAQLRGQAEDALIFWIHEMPFPHANGLRALSAIGSTKDLQALREWAKPTVPLPKEGQQPPMAQEWIIAQSALRYLGSVEDEQMWGWFEDALELRPKGVDLTMQSLLTGGTAMLGMSLRALGVGAAEGMAEWGNPKGFLPLLKYVERPEENEQSRLAACAALAWVATPTDRVTVSRKLEKHDRPGASDQFIQACLLETLITRPGVELGRELVKLIHPNTKPELRHQAARAIGKAGMTPEVEAQLFALMKDEVTRLDAALALIWGGSPFTAARTVGTLADSAPQVLEELQELWYRSFGYWSDEDLETGRIFRWVDNALGISHVRLNKTQQEWAIAHLMRQFHNLEFDNGPHSLTRVVLRGRLYRMARGKDAAKRVGAIRTLGAMREQGVLFALRDEPGEAGKLASEAYHELLNPKVFEGVRAIGAE